MKKTLLLLNLISSTCCLLAQSPLNWTSPVVVNSGAGTDWPRIALVHDTPVVAWGDFISGKIFCSRWTAGSFSPAIQLTPAGVEATVFSLTGPDLKAAGDTVFVTYVRADATHAYLHRSFDQGLTFSDTIRIDNIGNNYLQYASVGTVQEGNPVVTFAKLDVNSSNPQYVFTRSDNGGSTFSADNPVTAALGADPCDCCPGSIVCNGDEIAIIYRNAINNIRDMRAAISHDGGLTFALGNIDNNNWVLESCPSSGGEAVISGDTLISVFMNGVNGNKCYVSTLNTVTLQQGFEKPLFNLQGAASQNHPAIVASGDTIAVVWEQIINGHRNIMFTYSLTGPSGLGTVVDTISNVLTDGFHTNPDVAYNNGTFYVVFADEGKEQIYLMKGILYEVSGIQNTSATLSSLHITGNVQGNVLKIKSNRTITGDCRIALYNSNGSLCMQSKLHGLNTEQSLPADDSWTDGIYLLTVTAKDFTASGSMLIAR
ncbi:MAG: hypothetical protein K1X61_12790 [Chitinophagales bacterium]|nr:hypothetical protein [Chitinophagales bacterium]